jgi:hypothetical protein
LEKRHACFTNYLLRKVLISIHCCGSEIISRRCNALAGLVVRQEDHPPGEQKLKAGKRFRRSVTFVGVPASNPLPED